MTNVMKYRKNMVIVSEILESTKDCGQEGIKTTVLMQRANLPHNRLQTFIKSLTGNGLINKIEYDGKHVFVITDKGRLYLEKYANFSSFAESFGFNM